jgi:hypothetical protein
MQGRTAELLQLHTELRHTLFGSSSVLARSILPSAIPLDLLKFLKLWDYEGGLSPAVRYQCPTAEIHAASHFESVILSAGRVLKLHLHAVLQNNF